MIGACCSATPWFDERKYVLRFASRIPQPFAEIEAGFFKEPGFWSQPRLPQGSSHTPCAVTEMQKTALCFGGRHTECACYFGFAETL